MLNALGIDQDIYNTRTTLYQDLLIDANQSGIYVNHKSNIKHNETQQINLLLQYDKRVCFKVKDMTMQLNYKWIYHAYC